MKEVLIKITPVIVEESGRGYLVTINGKTKKLSPDEYRNTYGGMIKATSLIKGINGSIRSTTNTYQKLLDIDVSKLNEDEKTVYDTKMAKSPVIIAELEKLKRIRDRLNEIINDNNKTE